MEDWQIWLILIVIVCVAVCYNLVKKAKTAKQLKRERIKSVSAMRHSRC